MSNSLETSDLEEKRRKKLEQLDERHTKRPIVKESSPKINLDLISNSLLIKAESLIKSTNDSPTEINNLIKDIEEFFTTNDDTALVRCKNLREALDKLKQKIMVPTTKIAFSFGARHKNKHVKTVEKPKNTEEDKNDVKLDSSGIISIENLQHQIKTIIHADDSTLIIKDIIGCKLRFKFCAQFINLENIQNSTLIFLPIKTAILMHNCKNVVLVASAQQIRIHDSIDVKLFVYVRGSVIIENCSEIQVAPYQITKNEKMNLPTNFRNPEFWTNVQDFNWLAFHEKSPNWTKMDEEQWEIFDLDE